MGFLIPRASAAEGDVPAGRSRRGSGLAELGARGRGTRRSSSSCSCYPCSPSSPSLLFQQQATRAVTLPAGFALAGEELSPRSACGAAGSLALFPRVRGSRASCWHGQRPSPVLPSASSEGAWGQESSPETPLWLVPRWVWLCGVRGLAYEPFLHRLISARPSPLPQSARLAGYANVLGRVCLPVSLC